VELMCRAISSRYAAPALRFGVEKDRPAQSLEPPWGRASRLHRCSGPAATEQDLCKIVIATSQVNWATTLDCVLRLDVPRYLFPVRRACFRVLLTLPPALSGRSDRRSHFP